MKSSLALYERSPGRWYWQLSWYEDGKRKQLKRGGFPNRRDARRAGEAEEAKLRARAWRSETNDTLAAWSETWLGSLVVIGRKRSTINGYHRQLDTYVLPRLGGRKLAEIDTVSLDKLYAELLALGGRDGRALSARTVRFAHSILHKMFHDAVRKGLLAQNPAAYASAPSSKAARAPEATVSTPEELFAFLDASREDYYWPMWWTIAFTGLRRAEACGLRWCDVDLDAGMLEVAVTYNQVEGETYEDTTKSEQSERTVDIDAATVAVLRSWRARQAEIRLMVGTGWKDSGRVFCAPDGAAIRPDTLT